MSTEALQAMSVFNVRDFGASGSKDESAQAALQAAIDACAAAGGGLVYVPPGDYTTGTLHLRSHVRFYVETGATVWSSKDPATFDKRALFYAEDVHHISLEGHGTIDGQASYYWAAKTFDDWYIRPNQLVAEKYGVPLQRSFPTDNSIGNLVNFVRCTDIRIENLSFLHSPSWTMHIWGCERLRIDGVYVFTSREDGVWADGIDPDGCKDVHISNCTIDTGDDALVFYSGHTFGPARPCENITVTNCRLSSSSSALKFCDGNENAIRNVVIDNCVITDSNRGIAFMVFDGGILENVVISNVTIETRRHDWFWWGDADPLHFNLRQRSEIHPGYEKLVDEPPPGVIRNVILSNIIARGPGPNLIHGRADSPLENITFDNVRLTVVGDVDAPWKKGPVALTVENGRNIKLKDIQIDFETPSNDHWESALVVNNVDGLVLDDVTASQAPNGTQAPAVVLTDVQDVVVKNSRAAAGTGTFLHLAGERTQGVVLFANDLRHAQTGLAQAPEVAAGAVQDGWK